MRQFTERRLPIVSDDSATSVPSAIGRSMPLPSPGRTVVLGYDGSEAARKAATRAAEAAGNGGRLLVVTSAPCLATFAVDRELTDPAKPEQLLKEATALLGSHEIEVATRLEQGDPTEALIAIAREADADLIVVGARGRSFLARALRGSVAERLVARAQCPVLVVP